LKWDFGALTALGAGCREHLARGAVTATVTATGALCLPCLAAFRASFRLVGVAFGLEKLLLFGAESKRGTAIGAL